MLTFAELFAFCDLHASRQRGSCWAPTGVRYYDRAGFPIPDTEGEPACIQWAKLHEQSEYRQVARDELPDGSRLSTVWLGLDHAFLGPPAFFETMRFPADGYANLEFPDPRDGEVTTELRYGSEEEALAIHHAIVRHFRLTLGH